MVGGKIYSCAEMFDEDSRRKYLRRKYCCLLQSTYIHVSEKVDKKKVYRVLQNQTAPQHSGLLDFTLVHLYLRVCVCDKCTHYIHSSLLCFVYVCRAVTRPVLILLPVLGLTWLCGVLVHLSVVVAYIFIALNAFQVNRDTGLYLAQSAIDFVHWCLYNSYFAFDTHWNFPSTDTHP